MRLIKFVVSAVLLILVFRALDQKQGSIPPLGKFLDPFAGFWMNNERLDAIPDTLDLSGLRHPVTVVWDDREVPHIFAESTYDLYFAQGFLTARHRLWQMEFQTHYAAGRLSEVVGAIALPLDRLQRRRGMLMAAERAMQEITVDTRTQMVIQAYADGVNAWIDQLRPAKYPIEYKLLDYAPEPWSTLKTALLLKYMAWDLTGRNDEQDLTWILKEHGPGFINTFYPEVSPRTETVIPRGKRWRFDPLKLDPDNGTVITSPEAFLGLWDPQPAELNGSNNWAMSGSRTATGYPMLADDMHLSVNLPSLWYEVQLCDNEHNVYGVTLPGAPAVIVGFNDDIAWGLTNAGSDVYDWYEVEFRDGAREEYLQNGEWLPVEYRLEEIQIRDAQTVIDTLRLTHQGPVVHYGKQEDSLGTHELGMAMRWIAHDPSNELNTFLYLNEAETYDDFIEALKYFDCPAQNFVFASSRGNIAIQHNGKFPLRYRDQGKYVQDGRDSSFDWRGYIPRDHLPTFLNPYRGFVSSANQKPAGPRYPYYLGWPYETYERGARINERLDRITNAKMKDFQDLQMDPLNVHARSTLPGMLAALDSSDWDSTIFPVFHDLANWDYMNLPDHRSPWFFNQWWRSLEKAIWEDELTLGGELRRLPSRSVTAEFIRRGRGLAQADDSRTETPEDLTMMINRSFLETMDVFHEKYGAYGDAWNMGNSRGTDIEHILNLPGFGRTGLQTSGGRQIVNATDLDHAPSWRMVVQLGPEVKARGIYPGGQSGNPGSYYYDLSVDDWVNGKYYDLIFLPSPDEFPANHLGGSTLLRNTQ